MHVDFFLHFKLNKDMGNEIHEKSLAPESNESLLSKLWTNVKRITKEQLTDIKELLLGNPEDNHEPVERMEERIM